MTLTCGELSTTEASARLETGDASDGASESQESSSSKGSPASWDSISTEGSDPDFSPRGDTLGMDQFIVEHISYVWTILDQLTRKSFAIREAGTMHWFEEVDAALDYDAFKDFRSHLTSIILGTHPHHEALLDSGQDEDRASDYEILTSVQQRLVHANILRKHRIEFLMKSQASSERPKTDEIEQLKESPRLAAAVIATDLPATGSSRPYQTSGSPKIEPPMLQPDGVLICPYCDNVLPSSYGKDEQSWRYVRELRCALYAGIPS